MVALFRAGCCVARMAIHMPCCACAWYLLLTTPPASVLRRTRPPSLTNLMWNAPVVTSHGRRDRCGERKRRESDGRVREKRRPFAPALRRPEVADRLVVRAGEAGRPALRSEAPERPVKRPEARPRPAARLVRAWRPEARSERALVQLDRPLLVPCLRRDARVCDGTEVGRCRCASVAHHGGTAHVYAPSPAFQRPYCGGSPQRSADMKWRLAVSPCADSADHRSGH